MSRGRAAVSPTAASESTVVALTGVRRLEPRRVPRLRPLHDELLVRVAATGICGSDLAAYRGTHPYKTAPAVLGHEFAGFVERVGPGVTGFAEGDLVCSAAFSHCDTCEACRSGAVQLCGRKLNLSHLGWDGSFADRVLLRPNMTHRLAPGTHPVAGALVEPLSIGLHAMRASRTEGGVLVLGSGTVGLSCAVAARRLGRGPVVCVDLGPDKGRLARAIGADGYADAADGDPVERALSALGGRPADTVVIAAGYPGVLDQAVRAVRPGGEIVVVSYFEDRPPVDLNALVGREITVRTSALSTPRDFAEVIGWLTDGGLDPLPLVTHHFPLARAADALRLMDRADTPTGKIMLHVTTDPAEFEGGWTA